MEVAFVRGVRLIAFWLLVACIAASVRAQQKGQYLLGQSGLNAGVLPDPGVTYANLELDYDANRFNTSGGATLLKGDYNLWAVENAFYYVPKTTVFKAKIAVMMMFPTLANGSATLSQADFAAGMGGFGLADSWFQPGTLGWQFKRADTWAAYAFVAPTGRYSLGASNNIGSGYLGNKFATKIVQLDLIGYDQYQVTANSGSSPISGIPARLVRFSGKLSHAGEECELLLQI
jgi:hypothetical protein